MMGTVAYLAHNVEYRSTNLSGFRVLLAITAFCLLHILIGAMIAAINTRVFMLALENCYTLWQHLQPESQAISISDPINGTVLPLDLMSQSSSETPAASAHSNFRHFSQTALWFPALSGLQFDHWSRLCRLLCRIGGPCLHRRLMRSANQLIRGDAVQQRDMEHTATARIQWMVNPSLLCTKA